MSHFAKDNKGVALITVMLVFAIASAIAITLVSRQHRDIVRTTALLNQMQAEEYALGAEELARQILAEDGQTNPDIVYLSQRWASLQNTLPIENGEIILHIDDLQGRFNLNSLIGNTTAPTVQFGKLLKALDISTPVETIITELSRIAHPIYASADANGSFVIPDITSLRGIASLTREDYHKLLPYVSAVPNPSALLNINTASDTVIRTSGIEDNIIQPLMKLKENQGYITRDQLQSIGNTMGMGVHSNYFGLDTRVQLNGYTVHLYSVIRRSSNAYAQSRINVISRDMNHF